MTNQKTRKPIKCLDPQQQDKLYAFLDAAQILGNHAFISPRHACMILLCLDAGLRVSELCNLFRSDLYFGQGPVIDLTVRNDISKNHIERVIPLSERIRKSIQRLHDFDWAKYNIPGITFAFVTDIETHHITPRQFQRDCHRITLSALNMSFNPHALRHTFATKIMHLTDIRTVQMLLGHASLTSTQIYTHPSLSDLRAAINKTNGVPHE